jgi:cation transport ATPase
METIKIVFSVLVYVFLSGALVFAIFGGLRNIYNAWKTHRWKNVVFTVVVFIATIAFFVWADFFQILGDTCRFFYKLCQ